MRKVLTGNQAAAWAAALASVDVVAAYPITPATQVCETLAELQASGHYKGRYVKVESEHSAMSALLGAASAGARTFTATSSQGLAYMHEMLHWVSGARLPIVMVDVNRALAAPWNLWSDQSDSLSQRDTGWLQFYCASNQEVLDTTLMAFKISERLRLPSMVIMDGFTLSHTYEPVDVPGAEEVARFLPPWREPSALDPKRPAAYGALALPKEFTRLRRRLENDMQRALETILEISSEFEEAFGRSYGLIEPYRVGDAEALLFCAGAAASTMQEAVDALRARGKAAGGVRLRVARPFPTYSVRALSRPGVPWAVVDRAFSPGSGGVFRQELEAALYPLSRHPSVRGYIAGLGGADVTVELLSEIWEDAVLDRKDSTEAWMEDAR
ncbi:MAG: pyruvate ferredoxin oxidoreductase [Elusimicrobia bacterium]|nr:pyruvate ferredoxin oxidoreductase [Elusimicrobiota bacterium]